MMNLPAPSRTPTTGVGDTDDPYGRRTRPDQARPRRLIAELEVAPRQNSGNPLNCVRLVSACRRVMERRGRAVLIVRAEHRAFTLHLCPAVSVGVVGRTCEGLTCDLVGRSLEHVPSPSCVDGIRYAYVAGVRLQAAGRTSGSTAGPWGTSRSVCGHLTRCRSWIERDALKLTDVCPPGTTPAVEAHFLPQRPRLPLLVHGAGSAVRRNLLTALTGFLRRPSSRPLRLRSTGRVTFDLFPREQLRR